MNKISLAGSSQDQDLNYVFIMTSLILLLGYTVLLFFTVIRSKPILKQKNVYVTGKLYYILLILFLVYRIIQQIYSVIKSYQSKPSINEEEQINITKLIYNGFYISDCIFDLMFFNMFWQLLIFFVNAHIKVGVVQNKRQNFMQKRYLFYVYLIFYVLIHSTIILLYCFSANKTIISLKFYMLATTSNNCLCLIYFFIGILKYKIIYSGCPYKTQKAEKSSKHLIFIGYVWVIGRLVSIGFDIVIIINESRINELILGQVDKNSFFWDFISYFSLPFVYVLSEFIPIIYTIQLQTVQIYCLLFSSNALNDPLLSDTNQEPEQNDQSQLRNQSINDSENVRDVQQTAISSKEIQEEKQFEKIKEKRNGLGSIYVINKDKYIIQNSFRVIKVPQISQWILQEIESDIKQLKEIKIKGVQRIKEMILQGNDEIQLKQKYYKNGSLQEILFQKEKDQQKLTQFSFETKLKIALQISSILNELHSLNIYHGHLSSSNIFFDENFDIVISDLMFTNLKKYMSIKHSYINKSYYTAPEHILDKGLIVKNPNSKSDIYSFAFILWELFMESLAFPSQLSLPELKKIIIDENSRPKIPDNNIIPQEIASIIRYCWLKEPNDRPEFQVLLTIFQQFNKQKEFNSIESYISDQSE